MINSLSLFALLSPLVFVAIAVIAWFQPGGRPFLLQKLVVPSAIFAILIAAFCGFLVFDYGLLQSSLLGHQGLGLSVRIDPLSTVMSAMIALLSFVVLRFSMTYLDGDQRQGVFIGRLATTIASVQLLVLSANLGLLFIAWVLTSLSLHRLLVFYPDRPRAVIAARKKFIIARLGDTCLLGAVILLYHYFGTGDLETIFMKMKTISIMNSVELEIAAVFIALAAILKSAQFPTHGWLVEVMETPTPVSALLHAGLLNAGPFLVTRMAFVMNGASYAPVLLIITGGITGLFASVAFLTQPSVKTALGYSSVAHMGFMLMICGMGVYPAAMLHLVAHSFYKAHAFLSSGSTIDVVRASKVTLPKRLGNPLRIAASILLAFIIYQGVALLWGTDPAENLPLLAAGAIIVMGLSQMLAQSFDSSGHFNVMLSTSLLALGVATAFFSLEKGASFLLETQLPELLPPTLLTTVLILVILLTFGIAVLVQILAPALPNNIFWYKLGVHFRNGWYANALLDRMVGALKIRAATYNNRQFPKDDLPRQNILLKRTRKNSEHVMMDSL